MKMKGYQYADDAILYFHAKPKDIELLTKTLNESVEQLGTWAENNNLALKKNKSILISTQEMSRRHGLKMGVNIKPAVKLRKSDDKWKLANDYFAASMPISDLDKTDVELKIETMNSNVHTYFRDNCGLLDDSSSSLIVKYKDWGSPNQRFHLFEYSVLILMNIRLFAEYGRG